ncbi:MAG: thioredoxin family protein [Candidatus Omnitrophota bacterium]|jgi:uncharacterized protein YyaL (SSP411 family)
MKRTHLKTILSLVILVSFFAGNLHAINWAYDLKSALNIARQEKKPVLVDFYTDYCGWCKRMDKDTYGDRSVNRLSAFFVCAKIDGEKHPGIVRRYGIRAYPTTLFLNEKGAVIKAVRGYVGPDRFRKIMKSVLKRYKSPSVKGRGTKKAQQASQFALTGIIRDGVASKAVVNNNLVGIGDNVGGAKVIEIGRDEVTLSCQGKEIILKLE